MFYVEVLKNPATVIYLNFTHLSIVQFYIQLSIIMNTFISFHPKTDWTKDIGFLELLSSQFCCCFHLLGIVMKNNLRVLELEQSAFNIRFIHSFMKNPRLNKIGQRVHRYDTKMNHPHKSS